MNIMGITIKRSGKNISPKATQALPELLPRQSNHVITKGAMDKNKEILVTHLITVWSFVCEWTTKSNINTASGTPTKAYLNGSNAGKKYT